MLWLVIVLWAYFLMAIVSVFDRYFLVGPMANSKVYTFNIGAVGLIVCLPLIIFGHIVIPSINIFLIGLLAGLIRLAAVFFLNKSIFESEVSRAVPIIGSFQPIFSFLLFFLFFPQSRILSAFQIAAFILLVFGSLLISAKKLDKNFFNFQQLKYPLIASFLYSLTFFFIKNTFLGVDFLSGLFLIQLGSGLGSFGLIVFSKNRSFFLNQKNSWKTSGLFIFGQIIAGASILLQYYAVFLAKVAQVPLINALEGMRYVFLLFFVFLLGYWKPQILKEEVSRDVIFQKVTAVVLICGGLFLLVL